MSEMLKERSELMLRNAYAMCRNMRSLRGNYLWSFVGMITSHGSGYSIKICRELGWDPDMKIGKDLPARTQSTSKAEGA